MTLSGTRNLKIWAIVLGLIGFLVLAWYTVGNRADAKAREALDSILADAPSLTWSPHHDFFPFINQAHPLTLHSDQTFQSVLDELNQDFGLPFDFPKINHMQLQSPSIQIQETPDVYLVKIPVNNPSDAKNVQVQVAPHHIQISGQIANRNNDNFYSSSSFMQSFSTTAELDANRVQKKMEGDILIVTISKKHEAASRNLKVLPTVPSGKFI